MDALEALRTRRSVRKYRSDAVSKEDIETLVDMARLAASARNEQPWEFIVVTEGRIRQKLSEIATHGKFIADAPVCIVVVCKDSMYYLEDGSAATENILVAAHALGLGTCWVAGDKKEYAQDILNLLNVPAGYKLVSNIAVGYGEPSEPQKRSLDEVIHWEDF